MEQLYVDVSQQAFVWNPYLTLANVLCTFEVMHNVGSTNPGIRFQTDGQTESNAYMSPQCAIAQVS